MLLSEKLLQRENKRKLNTAEQKKIYHAGLYARISVEDERKKESQSIDNQILLLHKFAEEEPDISIQNIYADHGESGTNFDRGEWQNLMEDVRKGVIDCIIVKDLSRLGRNYIETGNYIEKIFPYLGVRFIAVNDHFDSADPQRNDLSLVVPLKNIVNESYARDISNKVKSSFAVKRTKGDYLGSFAPYGYLKASEDKHKLVVDPATAPIVRQIFKWVLEGYGVLKIANLLNDQKVPAPSKYRYGKGIVKNEKYRCVDFWYRSAVKRILDNVVYTGHMAQGKFETSVFWGNKRRNLPPEDWVIVRNTHDAIITEEDFQKVQKIRACRKGAYKQRVQSGETQNTNNNHLLGKMMCGECGRNMIRHKKVSKSLGPGYVFLCQTYEAVSKSACHKKTVEEEDIYEAIFSSIKSQIELCTQLEEAVREKNDSELFRNKRPEVYGHVRELEAKLSRIRESENALNDDYRRGLLLENEFTSIQLQYDTELKQIQKMLDKERKQQKDFKRTVTPQNERLLHFSRYCDTGRFTKAMISDLVEKVVVYSSDVIELRFRYMDAYRQILSFVEKY